jgi:hypothetical protein
MLFRVAVGVSVWIGARIFCSGTDIKVISSGMPPNTVESRGQNFVKWIDKLKERPAPIGHSEITEDTKDEINTNKEIKMVEGEETESIDAFKDAWLITEDDLVGESIFKLNNDLSLTELSSIKLKMFKRTQAQAFVEKFPELAKLMYEQACRVLGGNSETDLKLDIQPVAAG